MKTAALLNGEHVPELDAFTDRPTSRKLPERPPFPRTAKPYTRAKFGWIDQVSLDTGLSEFQVRVGIRIAIRHNMENGYAYMRHETIANEIGAKGTRGVKAAIDALEERGHLSVEYSSGAGRANRYFLIRKGKLKENYYPSEIDLKKVNLEGSVRSGRDGTCEGPHPEGPH
jgi:hypothetical protein